MARSPVPDHDLERAVEAYYDAAGNKADAARALGLKYQTYLDRLNMAQDRFGITLGKVADGRVEGMDIEARKLPPSGGVARYLLTSIQNNTHLHPGWRNLIALRDWLDGLDGGTCELMVGTFSYQMAAYGRKAVKRGTYDRSVNDALWYAPEAEPHIVDTAVELAPGLVWCGEQNILPTARHPLTAMEDYNGRKSNIVPHAKIAMESVASMADEPTKFNYSTGTMTQRNYIQKRAGILAEQKHTYGATLVEVDDKGVWFVRQLEVGPDNEIMDIGPRGFQGIVARDGQVTETGSVLYMVWGDFHAHELELWIKNAVWGDGGVLDTLQPEFQFMHDVFTMHSRGHHEIKDFHSRYRKQYEDHEVVEEEVEATAAQMNDADRPFCEMIVVRSNHDVHLDRWLNEADFRQDTLNARYFCWLQYHLLKAIDDGDSHFNVLEFALSEKGLNESIRFLQYDESFVLGGAENGLHGDKGPNGSRGSTRGLTKLGRKVNKAHDHTAAIRDQVFSAGACSMRFHFMDGPNTHSVSHIVGYRNGARAIMTMFAGKWRA